MSKANIRIHNPAIKACREYINLICANNERLRKLQAEETEIAYRDYSLVLQDRYIHTLIREYLNKCKKDNVAPW